jgi:hypothetical protein
VRYFHQSPDYWLDHGTLQDWREIYHRELIEAPPAEALLADHFGYEGPGCVTEPEDAGEVVSDLPEFES